MEGTAEETGGMLETIDNVFIRQGEAL